MRRSWSWLSIWSAAWIVLSAGLLAYGIVFDIFWLIPINSFGLTIHTINLVYERRRHGRRRQAAQDHRDPQAHGGSTPPGSITGTSQRAGQGAGTSAVMHAWQAQMLAQMPPSWGRSKHVQSDKRPALEVVHDDQPILARRYARLSADEGRLTFTSVTRNGGTFGVDSDATCARIDEAAMRRLLLYGPMPTPHPAPDPDCTCGFYTVPADQRPPSDDYDGRLMLLLVELSGRVIECEKGYRAEHQRVIAAEMPDCVCRKPAVEVWIGEGWGPAWSCGEHRVASSTSAVLSFTPEQLTRALGVRVAKAER